MALVGIVKATGLAEIIDEDNFDRSKYSYYAELSDDEIYDYDREGDQECED